MVKCSAVLYDVWAEYLNTHIIYSSFGLKVLNHSHQVFGLFNPSTRFAIQDILGI
jgi:hypothetical protein